MDLAMVIDYPARTRCNLYWPQGIALRCGSSDLRRKHCDDDHRHNCWSLCWPSCYWTGQWLPDDVLPAIHTGKEIESS